MSVDTVRTRFAPSPTGGLHIGNVRTALFNYLAARGAGGQFLLRAEDTDRERSDEARLADALGELAWLGLDWEEGPDVGGPRGPYRQSERASHYAAALERLKASGVAYPCWRTEEELAEHRREQIAAGRPPRYDREWARLDPAGIRRREASGQQPAWRLKVPANRGIAWQDLIRGEQRVPSDELGDFVLMRSDATPGFIFSNALDDALMGVTLVLRGEDHTSNTPRQLLVLEALGMAPPRYGHLSLVVDPNGRPLSKRAGSPGIASLREQGYLAAGVVNHLARLGHGLDGDGLLALPELAARFDPARLSRSPARFDTEQLDHWQHLALAAAGEADLRAWAGGAAERVPSASRAAFLEVIRPNAITRADVADWSRRLFGSDDPELSADALAMVREAGPRFFAAAAEARDGGLTPMAGAARAATGRKGRQLYLPLRLALTGLPDGPELGPVLDLMPDELVHRRLARWAGASGAQSE